MSACCNYEKSYLQRENKQAIGEKKFSMMILRWREKRSHWF